MQTSCRDYMIKVNANRFKEGARVLEDVARFFLKDLILFDMIKKLKHEASCIEAVLFDDNDIGGSKYQESYKRTNLIELVNANACRMQEAARVLEEIYDRNKFKTIRFKSYEIHYKLLKQVKCFLNLDKLNGIYPICDQKTCSLEKMASVINHSNITICQLRIKSFHKKEIYDITKKFKSLLYEHIVLILNDHVDIAMTCADGVHLGQNDLPVKETRSITNDSFIIGVTCHSLKEAQNAQSAGANYVSVGCLFPTKTKKDTIPTSIKTLAKIKNSISLPVCAIGGINASNISKLLPLNIDMLAMHNAIWPDKYNNA